MNIIPYDHSMKPAFSQLLCTYFQEIDAGIPEKIIHRKLMDLIETQADAGILQVATLWLDGALQGFSIYQIDTPESDWCKQPGWGFIREFYVAPALRRQGFGSKLAAYSETHLRQLGAASFYLTSDSAAQFWEAMGFKQTKLLSSNGLPVFEKGI